MNEVSVKVAERLAWYWEEKRNVNYLLLIMMSLGIGAGYLWHKFNGRLLYRQLFYPVFDTREDDGEMMMGSHLPVSDPAMKCTRECHLLPYQRKIKQFDNGDFLLSSYIDYPKQFFPLVQHWHFHLPIIFPLIWQCDKKERITTRCNVT